VRIARIDGTDSLLFLMTITIIKTLAPMVSGELTFG